MDNLGSGGLLFRGFHVQGVHFSRDVLLGARIRESDPRQIQRVRVQALEHSSAGALERSSAGALERRISMLECSSASTLERFNAPLGLFPLLAMGDIGSRAHQPVDHCGCVDASMCLRVDASTRQHVNA